MAKLRLHKFEGGELWLPSKPAPSKTSKLAMKEISRPAAVAPPPGIVIVLSCFAVFGIAVIVASQFVVNPHRSSRPSENSEQQEEPVELRDLRPILRSPPTEIRDRNEFEKPSHPRRLPTDSPAYRPKKLPVKPVKPPTRSPVRPFRLLRHLF